MFKVTGMVSREHWDLRGPVKSCVLRRRWYLGEEQSDTTILEFRRDGACERRWNRDPRGSEWSNVYEYDGSGRLIVATSEGPHGWRDTRVYEYDSAGRISRILARDAEGRGRVAETYSYDAAGLKTHTRHLESDICANVFWAVEGTDACFAARGAVAITTLFDAHDRPVTALFIDQADHIVNRVNLRYDEAGNLIEEQGIKETDEPLLLELTRLPGASDGSTRRFFRYDERGRRIEIVAPSGPLGVHRKVIAYNEQGDKSRVISTDQDREYEIDEEGHISNVPIRVDVHESWTRFRYHYDAQGNWVEQLIEGRSDAAKEWVVDNITHRTIAYFA